MYINAEPAKHKRGNDGFVPSIWMAKFRQQNKTAKRKQIQNSNKDF